MTETTTEKRNGNLHAAKRAKNDEFYTRLEDIENELRHYRDHFKDKTVFLNCDDPRESNFWFYFAQNFEILGLRRLISTHYREDEGRSFLQEIVRREAGGDVNGDGRIDIPDPVVTDLEGNGDFRSPECVELLKQADIVVTNPPFSLFREFIGLLMDHRKQFLVVGNMNAITYKEIWPLIESGQIWLGAKTGAMKFRIPNAEDDSRADADGLRSFGNICWFTNLDHGRRHEEIPLYVSYAENPEKYPQYDNYDAIEVAKVAEIPFDYDGAMGVPITFLGKHNPDQFDLIGLSSSGIAPEELMLPHFKNHHNPYLNGEGIYRRIFIRRRIA